MNTDKIEVTQQEDEAFDVIKPLSSSVEWNSGDECVYKHKPNDTYVFIGMHPKNQKSAICWNEDDGISQIHIDYIRKPESPEQKAERERVEAIETMCEEVDRLPHGEAFAAMATLYDLGYRKDKA